MSKDIAAAIRTLLVAGLSIAALAAIMMALGRFRAGDSRYQINVAFKDVKGLGERSSVRMQGVRIGEVTRVRLERSRRVVIVTVAINRDVDIADDARFKIVSGILITTPQMEITDGMSDRILAKDNSVEIAGAESGGPLEAFSPELQQTVLKMNSTFDNLNAKFNVSATKINKILDQTATLLETGNKTLSSAQGVIGDPEMKSNLKTIVRNMAQASDSARLAAKQLPGTLQQLMTTGKGTFEDLRGSLLDIFEGLNTTLDEANSVVRKLTEQVTDPRLQQSLQDTVELARTTLARFNQLASDLHQFIGDPQLQNDLKKTVENLKIATARGADAVEKVNTLINNVSGPEGKAKLPSLPKIDLVTNASEQIDPERFRLDVEARIALSRASMLNLGIYDLGQDSRVIFQAGSKLNPNLTMRYGMFASRLGAGLDWTLSDKAQLRADLYDTVRPRLDLRALYKVNNSASLWIGADGIFARPVPRLGIQLNR